MRTILTERELVAIDAGFVAHYVSNPWSGDVVKGHAIVAAELGLVAYKGKAVRDPSLFDGDWAKARRAEHLLVRMALTAELWRRTSESEVTLYRAVSAETTVHTGARPSFVSATLSPDVAAAHFAGGARTRAAAMYRLAPPSLLLSIRVQPTPINAGLDRSCGTGGTVSGACRLRPLRQRARAR